MKHPTRTSLEIAGVVAIGVLAYALVDAVQARNALRAERDGLRQHVAANRETPRLPEGRRAGPSSFASPGVPSEAPVPATGRPLFAPTAGALAFRGGPHVALSDGRDGPPGDHLRSHLQRRYQALFEQAGFPREQAEALVALLVEKHQVAADVMDSAITQGLLPGPDNHRHLQSLVQSGQDAVEERIRQLLGENAYGQYQDFERTMPHRSTVEQLANRLAAVGESLSATQAEQLASLLAATAPAGDAGIDDVGPVVTFSSDGGMVAGHAISVGGGAPISEEAVEQAASFLTDAQRRALQQLQADRSALQRMVESTPARNRTAKGRASP